MSWEYDKGTIIFLGVLGVFIVFCGIMAVRSAKRQKHETREEQKLRRRINQEMSRRGVILFFALLWLASGMLIFSLNELGMLDQSFKIPRFLLFFYDIFGITAGALVQTFVCFVVIIATIVSMIKKRRKMINDFIYEDKSY